MTDQTTRFALALLREGVAIFDPAKEQPDILLEWLKDVSAFLNTAKVANFASPGLDLVTRERFEQIEKHGRTLDFDKEHNTRGQLKRAALYCLTLNPEHWPADWDENVRENIYQKGHKERYIIAAALLTAEVDLLSYIAERDEYDGAPDPTDLGREYMDDEIAAAQKTPYEQ